MSFNGPGNFKTFLETLVSCLVSKNVNKQFIKDYLSLQEIQVRFFKFWQKMMISLKICPKLMNFFKFWQK